MFARRPGANVLAAPSDVHWLDIPATDEANTHPICRCPRDSRLTPSFGERVDQNERLWHPFGIFNEQ
jgi:hypothetical protein